MAATKTVVPQSEEPNYTERIAAEKAALVSATKMLNDNSTPSTQLQVEIIKAATELIRAAKC